MLNSINKAWEAKLVRSGYTLKGGLFPLLQYAYQHFCPWLHCKLSGASSRSKLFLSWQDLPVPMMSMPVSCVHVEQEVQLLTNLELRKRHTTAQSSTLAVGNLVLQARMAKSTRIWPALECGADATMPTTSSLERTSHSCQTKEQKQPSKFLCIFQW